MRSELHNLVSEHAAAAAGLPGPEHTPETETETTGSDCLLAFLIIAGGPLVWLILWLTKPEPLEIEIGEEGLIFWDPAKQAFTEPPSEPRKSWLMEALEEAAAVAPRK